MLEVKGVLLTNKNALLELSTSAGFELNNIILTSVFITVVVALHYYVAIASSICPRSSYPSWRGCSQARPTSWCRSRSCRRACRVRRSRGSCPHGREPSRPREQV